MRLSSNHDNNDDDDHDHDDNDNDDDSTLVGNTCIPLSPDDDPCFFNGTKPLLITLLSDKDIVSSYTTITSTIATTITTSTSTITTTIITSSATTATITTICNSLRTKIYSNT